MNVLKCAVACSCLVLAATAAQADDPDPTAHNLAAQCAAKNGTFDPNSNECHEPSADSAAGDLVVGPMMKVLGPEAQGTEGSTGSQ